MATITINTPAGQDARILTGFGRALGLNRDATAAEVKGAMMQYLIDTVRGAEIRIASESIAPVTPT